MAEKVYVTGAQADAARMIVERDSAKGKETPASIRKIAEAQVQPALVRAKQTARKLQSRLRIRSRLRPGTARRLLAQFTGGRKS